MMNLAPKATSNKPGKRLGRISSCWSHKFQLTILIVYMSFILLRPPPYMLLGDGQSDVGRTCKIQLDPEANRTVTRLPMNVKRLFTVNMRQDFKIK